MTATTTQSTTPTPTWVPMMQQVGPYLAFGQALVAMLGSLYFSEMMGFLPCTLCWYQRILMYPLVVITIVGIVKHDEYLPNYVLPFSLLGMCLSFYHYMIQIGVVTTSSGCTTLSCGERYVNYLGFVTIPLMAFTAFTIINVVMVATYMAYRQSESID